MSTPADPIDPTYPTYPVRVDARVDHPLSRWLWLVKWIILLPHYVVLFFLWIAFGLLTVVAFVAILITAGYPRPIFDFNLGVLRWTWRVGYYSYTALGTDRYPPFSLAEHPDYPATLHVPHPARLSRGLVLVKWWLLALPHYLVIAIFAGWRSGWGWDRGGLIKLLVLFVAISLTVRDRYPRGLYDLIMGMNRWVLRVAAYAALMTDAYPPFRLDQGGLDPGGPPPGPASGTPTTPPPG